MRKLFTLLLAVAASVGTMFAEKVPIGDLYYYLDVTNQTAEVAGNSIASGDIIIPSSVTYNSVSYSVTSIGDRAFYYCTGLTSVTIPNSVTSIGGSAFSGCSGLTSIEIPNSVTSIGEYAFAECRSLTSVTIPNSVTSIESWAFYKCTGLTSVTIGNSVTSIGDYAFYYCSGLTSVTIPNSVTSIGDYAFRGCTGLTSVTIPNSVTSIGGSAFRGCTGLTSVTIPNSVTSIGGSAFSGCSGLTSIEIPNSVTSIGDYTFFGCTGLTSVTIPNSVTSIGEYAFYGCSGLTSVTIPNSVTSIGEYAFYGCSGLTSVTIPNSVTSIAKYAFYGCDSLTSIDIPNSVITIGQSAFNGLNNVNYTGTALGAPWGAKHMNRTTYIYGVSGILAYTSSLPSSVTSEDYYLFSGVISSIEGVATGYGNATFYVTDGTSTFYCYRIYDYYSTTITNSNQLHVGDSVVISSKVQNYKGNTPEATQGRLVYHSANPLYTNDSIYYYGKRVDNPNELKLYNAFGVDTLNIPEIVSIDGTDYTVTEIAGDAFYNRSALKCVKLPKTLRYMSNAFNKCGNIETIYYNAKNLNKPTKHSFADSKLSVKNVYIGEDVESLPDSVFSNLQAIEKVEWNAINCSGTIPPFYSSRGTITSFNFGEKVSSIPTRLCQEMTGITSVTIPESVQSTGMFPFWGCSGLRSATWNAVNCTTHDDGQYVYPPFQKCENLTNFTIGENVESLPRGLCYAMPISSVVIPNKVKSIGVSAFRECANLKSIEIPNSVTSIGDFAFEFCSSANPLKIGNSVTSIGEQAFAVCSSVTSIEIPRSVTSLGKYAFAECENLDTLYLGENITAYGDSVFAWCTKLSAIYNYREKPAKLGKGAFDGVDYFNCTLYVLAGSVDMYKSTGSDWKDFYFVEPIGANTTSLNANEVTVVPAENTALFTWPTSNNAASYTIQITKDGVVFCTLVFNSNGQLTGIAFAPSRNGASHAPAATMSVAGMSFTVTGLNGASRYFYTLETKDANGQIIKTYTGMFATEGYVVPVFTITFVNYDGTQLQSGEIAEGEIPQYTGVTPTKPEDEQNTYTFSGWTPEIVAVTENATYTATFTATAKVKYYTITFVNYDGTQLQSGEIAEGEIPQYTGVTPTKPEDEQNTYTFSGWTPQIVAATQNATYTATYAATSKGQGVDEVQSDQVQSTKLLRDGQIYILRGEKVYTLTGAEVK